MKTLHMINIFLIEEKNNLFFVFFIDLSNFVFFRFNFCKSRIKCGFPYQLVGAAMVRMTITDGITKYDFRLVFSNLLNNLFLMSFIVFKKTGSERKFVPGFFALHPALIVGLRVSFIVVTAIDGPRKAQKRAKTCPYENAPHYSGAAHFLGNLLF